MSSRALKVNIENHRVEVTINPKYHVIQELFTYRGAFLLDIHPLKGDSCINGNSFPSHRHLLLAQIIGKKCYPCT